MLMIKRIIIAAILIFPVKYLFASTAGAFTRVDLIGAENVAMGGTGEAVSDDVFAVYWNPAGLVDLADRKLSAEKSVREKVKNGDIEQISEEELTDFSKPARKRFFVFGSSASAMAENRQLIFAASAFNIGKSVFAFGMSTLYSGDIESRDSSGNSNGKTSYSGTVGYLTFAYDMKSTSVGFSLKPLYETVDDQKYAGGAADIGLKAEFLKVVKIGFVFQDLGIGLYPVSQGEDINKKYETGSPLVRAGMAINPIGSDFTASSSVVKKFEKDEMEFNFGIRYLLNNSFSVAVGFNDGMFASGCRILLSLIEVSYSMSYDNIDSQFNNTVTVMMVF